MAITFWCAECGTRLEADEADAGREVECGGCRAVVRVPRNPPPDPGEYEGDDGDRSGRAEAAFPAADVAPAREAFGMLQLSLILYVFGFVFGMIVNGLRVAFDGLNAVLRGDPGNSRPLIIAGGVVGILVLLTGGYLRVAAYRRCLPVGRRVGSETGLVLGGLGAFGYALGSILASAPGMFITNPNQINPLFVLMIYGGGLLALAGFGFESAVLLFYHRLLAATRGRAEARQVVTYAVTFGVSVVVGFFAACGFGMAIGFAAAAGAGRRAPGAPPPGINAANVPDEIWAIGGVLAALMLLAVGLLCWQYYRILSRCRAALAAATRADPAAEV